MNLLEIVQLQGYSPKRVSSVNGGEYHSPCPACGGKDRFSIHLGKDRYYCRQCKLHGDSIQFCRDFLGMDYRSACAKVGVVDLKFTATKKAREVQFVPKQIRFPSKEWQAKAADFVMESHQALIDDPKKIHLLKNTRGLSIETIKSFSLGWNFADRWISSRSEWGLSREFHESGHEKKLWIPKGIVIPTIVEGIVVRLKIRRLDWIEGDKLGKYIIFPGSSAHPSIFGERLCLIVVLVEAELDAMLVIQEAGDLCCCITFGGLGHPDEMTHQWLQSKKTIICALDFDDAGRKASLFWRSTYPNLCMWPVPVEKGPCDAFLAGIDLRRWIAEGIRSSKNPL
jgi:DNA primase